MTHQAFQDALNRRLFLGHTAGGLGVAALGQLLAAASPATAAEAKPQLGLPGLPVDTHVWRVSRRLGLIDDKTDANALFDAGFLTEAYRQASRVYKWDMLEGRAKEQWTMRSEPAGSGATLIDAAVALNTPQAAEMRKARLLLH